MTAVTLEMQLQVDGEDSMMDAPDGFTAHDDTAHAQPDSDAGAEKLSPTPPNISPVIQESESIYDAAIEFKKSKPLHCQLPAGTLFNKRYKIVKIIGKGSFGCAYLCTDVLNGGEVVVKARVGNREKQFSESIYDELQVYLQLGATTQQVGIPYIAGAGVHKMVPSTSDGKPVYVSYIAMQRLGDSIWTCCHRTQQSKVINKQTGHEEVRAVSYQPTREVVIFAGLGMLKALAAMHAHGVIHRDVKTENFCLGGDRDNENIYVIDYGFARPAFGWYPYHKYEHKCATFWGTPNYSSLRALQRYPQTSRDDLEALVYCIMEMEMPHCLLPWNSKLTTNSEAAAGWTDEQLHRMACDKLDFIKEACEDGLVPDYLMDLLDYVHSLKHTDVPDYVFVHMLLQSGLSGKAPTRRPVHETYTDWPEEGCTSQEQHQSVTHSLLDQLKDAASKVLRLSDDTPSLSQDEAAAVSSAVLSPQKQQVSLQHDQQQQGAMSGLTEQQCCSESESGLEGVDACETVEENSAMWPAHDIGGGGLTGHQVEVEDTSVQSQSSSAMDAGSGEITPIDFLPPQCSSPTQQNKRQKTDKRPAHLCATEILQVVLDCSQQQSEE